jgi:hypothetical protein
MLSRLASAFLPLAATLVCAAQAPAQEPCGVPGVDVTVSPAFAAPGETIHVTLTNDAGSGTRVMLSSSCLYRRVYAGPSCDGKVVELAGPCLKVILGLSPGESYTDEWDQTDFRGLQVPEGVYSFEIAAMKPTDVRCCVSVSIGVPAFTYCEGKPNSQGCRPHVVFSGTPSATSPRPFRIEARRVVNNKPGLLFYGGGKTALPFQGGTLCVQAPLTRLPVQSSGGNVPPDDCSGSYAFDMNAHIQSGVDPFLAMGAIVTAQFWQRDPAHPDGTGVGLTDAIWFSIQG